MVMIFYAQNCDIDEPNRVLSAVRGAHRAPDTARLGGDIRAVATTWYEPRRSSPLINELRCHFD